MAGVTSSGQVARALIFAKEDLGSDEIQEFFHWEAPKGWKDTLISLIYSDG